MPSSLNDLDEAGGVYGYEASRREMGLSGLLEGEIVLYPFSGSACANFGFSEKKQAHFKNMFQIWVSRITI